MTSRIHLYMLLTTALAYAPLAGCSSGPDDPTGQHTGNIAVSTASTTSSASSASSASTSGTSTSSTCATGATTISASTASAPTTAASGETFLVSGQVATASQNSDGSWDINSADLPGGATISAADMAATSIDSLGNVLYNGSPTGYTLSDNGLDPSGSGEDYTVTTPSGSQYPLVDEGESDDAQHRVMTHPKALVAQVIVVVGIGAAVCVVQYGIGALTCPNYQAQIDKCIAQCKSPVVTRNFGFSMNPFGKHFGCYVECTFSCN